MNGSTFRRRFGTSRQCICLIVIFVIVVIIIFLRNGETTKQTSVERPTGVLKYRIIPRIIHQTFMGRRIPATYWSSVATWRKHHPDYVYFLWTDEDIKRFIATEYPHFVKLFESYQHKLQRVDAVRYFILYHYGGVYADMDVSALKTLDPLLSRYSCIISRERYEQSLFLWGRPQILMNAIMASAPRHPFMKFVMFNLHTTAWSDLEVRLSSVIHHSSYILATTGPLALTDIYKRYPPCLITSEGGVGCDVYLAPPQQLLPRIKPDTLDSIRTYCCAWYFLPLRFLSSGKTLRACAILEQNSYFNQIPSVAFTDHEFSNLGYFEINNKGKTFQDISQLVGYKWRQYIREPSNSSGRLLN